MSISKVSITGFTISLHILSLITLYLTEAAILDLAGVRDDPEITFRIKTKHLVIRMHHEWSTNGFIGKVIALSITTPVAYIKHYRDWGLAELIEDRYYKQSSSL